MIPITNGIANRSPTSQGALLPCTYRRTVQLYVTTTHMMFVNKIASTSKIVDSFFMETSYYTPREVLFLRIAKAFWNHPPDWWFSCGDLEKVFAIQQKSTTSERCSGDITPSWKPLEIFQNAWCTLYKKWSNPNNRKGNIYPSLFSLHPEAFVRKSSFAELYTDVLLFRKSS